MDSLLTRNTVQPAVSFRRGRTLLEAVLAALGAAALTVATNLDQVRTLTSTVPGDLIDPPYFAWQLAWVGHAVRTDPGGLWTTNAFLRAPDNLAYTDTVLGYLPLSFVAPGGQAGALAQLNLATLLSTAMAILGGYLLARVLGARIPGALVAAAGFGFAPWRLTHIAHINVLSTGGIALTLALLAHGHAWSLRHGWRPERIRPWAIVGGWLTACWQLSFGFATGIWFAYTLALVMLALALGWLTRGRRRLSLRPLLRRTGVPDAAGGLLFLLVAWLLVQPYLRVIAAHPEAQRQAGMLDRFSPPWYGLLTAPATDRFWAHRLQGWRDVLAWKSEKLMSPGIFLCGLAVAGLFISSWPVRRRLAIATSTAVLVVLAMGTRFPGHGSWTYLPLYRHLPGWADLRTPGRLMIWVTIGLCLLAAGAVSKVGDGLVQAWRDAGDRPPGHRRALASAVAVAMLVLPAAVVVGEGLNTTPHLPLAGWPVRLATLRQPILVLPTAPVADYQVMLWSTQGWPVIANGDSGFRAKAQDRLRRAVQGFPDAASVQYCRDAGIATVVVIRSRTSPRTWSRAAEAPVDGLGVTRIDTADAVVFEVR